MSGCPPRRQAGGLERDYVPSTTFPTFTFAPSKGTETASRGGAAQGWPGKAYQDRTRRHWYSPEDVEATVGDHLARHVESVQGVDQSQGGLDGS